MIIEIYITFAIVGITTLLLGFIYADRTEGVLLLPFSAVLCLITSLASGDIEVLEWSSGQAISQTVGYSSLMALFSGLFLLATALTFIYTLSSYE